MHAHTLSYSGARALKSGSRKRAQRSVSAGISMYVCVYFCVCFVCLLWLLWLLQFADKQFLYFIFFFSFFCCNFFAFVFVIVVVVAGVAWLIKIMRSSAFPRLRANVLFYFLSFFTRRCRQLQVVVVSCSYFIATLNHIRCTHTNTNAMRVCVCLYIFMYTHFTFLNNFKDNLE